MSELIKDKSSLTVTLLSQIRSKGGILYSDFIMNLMRSNLSPNEKFESDHYEILITDNLVKLQAKIRERDKESGISRLVAGFSWKWVSKKAPSLYDIHINGLTLRWNKKTVDWINSTNAINEVGCIHTTQGYDLNYVGIIFGNEIGYDLKANRFIIRRSEYEDKSGKNTATDDELKTYIVNIYQTLLLRGMKGTYIYCCDPGLREYIGRHINLF
jgi:uncharacterized protein